MTVAESLLKLRVILVDGMADKIKALQNYYDAVDWDSVDILELMDVSAKLDRLLTMFATIIVNNSNKLKPE